MSVESFAMPRRRWMAFLVVVRLLVGLARSQLHRWRQTVRYSIRAFLLFPASSLCALLPLYVFSQLPDRWLDVVLEHLFTVQGLWVALILLYLHALNLLFGVLTYKVLRTL